MLVWMLVGLVVAGFGVGALWGAPYLPILKTDSNNLLALVSLQPGQRLIDLGCGDGRFLKAAACRGIKATGYEINPWLYVAARLNCWRYRQLVDIHLADFWQAKLPPADAIYVFLIDRYMARLDQKLQAEITSPTKVISYIFAIPGVRAVTTTKNSYVYHYPKSAV